MERLTYNQAYDKIIQAYFKDEIEPYNSDFCFCGTVSNGKCWFRGECENYYPSQFKEMEFALLDNIRLGTLGGNDIYFAPPFAEDLGRIRIEVKNHPNYEEALFIGMCAALNVLKEIHRSRGENVDDVPAFTKRPLSPA